MSIYVLAILGAAHYYSRDDSAIDGTPFCQGLPGVRKVQMRAWVHRRSSITRTTKGLQLYLLAVVLIILASGTPAAAVEWGKVSAEEWALGAPEDYPEANALILLDSANFSVVKWAIVMDYYVRIKVLTRAGIDEVGEQSISWHKKYDKVRWLKAHTITPDGKKHKVDKKSIFEKESGSYKIKSFAFPVLDSGCIVEFRYSINSEWLGRLRPWYFQDDLYTLRSQLTMSLAPGFSYDIDYYKVPRSLQDPVVTKHVDRTSPRGAQLFTKSFTWAMENLPPVKDEPYMSCMYDYCSALRFQLIGFRDHRIWEEFQRTWKDLGHRMQVRIDDYCNDRGRIRALAREITAGLSTQEEKSRAIFDFVKSEYRTVDEYNSYFYCHDKISRLLDDKYGSGEGKNVLLAEMHKAVDIPSWPVLISTRDHEEFKPRFPDLRQFNYMITFVQIGDGWVFLDAANPLSVYGLLPPSCLVNGGFLIDDKESQLVTIGVNPITSYRADSSVVRIAADGRVKGRSDCKFVGYYASQYSERYRKADPEEFVEQNFTDRLTGTCTIDDYTCTLDSMNRFIVTLEFSADDMVRKLDNNVLVEPLKYAFRRNPFKSSKRFFPVDFMYPFSCLNHTEVLLEDTTVEMVPPANTTLEIPGASFVRQSFTTDSSVVVQSRLQIDQVLFKPRQYSRLRDFFEQLALACNDEIVFVTDKP